MGNTEKQMKVTYREKKARHCPICEKDFYHEKLLSGRGRLIAGKLRPDLRRLYEESKKFGKVYPLIYTVVVCPRCYYATFEDDFNLIDGAMISGANEETEQRIRYTKAMFGSNIDFNEERNLITGAASYFLAISSYVYHKKEVAPTFKKALASIRGSWVVEDLAEEFPNEGYEDIAIFFKNKAKNYYKLVIDFMQSGKEKFDGISFGPDVDKNFGYEGTLYLSSYLCAKMAFLVEDPEKRAKELIEAKRRVAKIFGTGKSSKAKPSEFLDFARDVYGDISDYLEELGEKYDIETD